MYAFDPLNLTHCEEDLFSILDEHSRLCCRLSLLLGRMLSYKSCTILAWPAQASPARKRYARLWNRRGCQRNKLRWEPQSLVIRSCLAAINSWATYPIAPRSMASKTMDLSKVFFYNLYKKIENKMHNSGLHHLPPPCLISECSYITSPMLQ